MTPILLLAGRILIAVLFIGAALSKLGNVSGTIGYFEGLGLPLAWLVIWPVIAIELVGGLALLVGYQVKISALALAAFCIAAALAGHRDWSDLMHFQAFMKDIAIAGGLMFVYAHGAGRYSVAAWLADRKAGSSGARKGRRKRSENAGPDQPAKPRGKRRGSTETG